MLKESQIRKLIVHRLFTLQGCKDRNYLWHHIGVIRGMVWTLNGKDCGDLTTTHEILQAIDVPYTVDDTGEVFVDVEWLKENNLEIGLNPGMPVTKKVGIPGA
jgi:hypothetical protein